MRWRRPPRSSVAPSWTATAASDKPVEDVNRPTIQRMFDVSGTELIIILLVALVVFGPQRLPELARKVGGWARSVREAATDLRRGLDDEVAVLREPMDEARRTVDDVRRSVTGAGGEAKRALRSIDGGVKPRSGPGPGGVSPPETPEPADGEAAADDERSATTGPKVQWVGPVSSTGPTPDDAYADLAALEERTDTEGQP
jgi:sec-independent protein translocase protein TatB